MLTSKNDKNDTAAASLFQQAQFAESGWEAHWNSGTGQNFNNVYFFKKG